MMQRPNSFDCEGCEDWNDIDGCFDNHTCYCGRFEEEMQQQAEDASDEEEYEEQEREKREM